MKTVIWSVLIFLFLFGGCITPDNSGSSANNSNLLVSGSSVQGMGTTAYIFPDQRFISVSTNVLAYPEGLCEEGSISQEQLNLLFEDFKLSGFFEAEVIPANPGCLGEGNSWLYAKIEEKSNRIIESCETDGSTDNRTISALSIKRELAEKISAAINSAAERNKCKVGSYIEVSSLHKTCEEKSAQQQSYGAPAITYKVYSDEKTIPSFLRESMKFDGAPTFAGDYETAKFYHRGYFEFNGECYFQFIYEFDGERFLDGDNTLIK